MSHMETGQKYYDFEFHYFSVQPNAFGELSVNLTSRVLIFKCHNGSGTEEALQQHFSDCVSDSANTSFEISCVAFGGYLTTEA